MEEGSGVQEETVPPPCGDRGVASDVTPELEEGEGSKEPVPPNDGETAATALASLSLDVPPMFSAGGYTEDEHPTRTQKHRAQRKRDNVSARRLRRSTRLQAKEEPAFKLLEEKAARV